MKIIFHPKEKFLKIKPKFLIVNKYKKIFKKPLYNEQIKT
jgi:hypothetical protein